MANRAFPETGRNPTNDNTKANWVASAPPSAYELLHQDITAALSLRANHIPNNLLIADQPKP